MKEAIQASHSWQNKYYNDQLSITAKYIYCIKQTCLLHLTVLHVKLLAMEFSSF